MSSRTGEIQRKTKETDIEARLALAGGAVDLEVPNGFFAHTIRQCSGELGAARFPGALSKDIPE